MKALPGRVFLVVGFFSFITLNVSSHSLLTCRVFTKKSAYSLMEVLLYIICCFSLAPYYSLFIFNFPHFNYNVSWCGPFLVGPVWDFLCFLVLDVCFLSQVSEVFGYYCLQICYLPLSLFLVLLGPQ